MLYFFYISVTLGASPWWYGGSASIWRHEQNQWSFGLGRVSYQHGKTEKTLGINRSRRVHTPRYQQFCSTPNSQKVRAVWNLSKSQKIKHFFIILWNIGFRQGHEQNQWALEEYIILEPKNFFQLQKFTKLRRAPFGKKSARFFFTETFWGSIPDSPDLTTVPIRRFPPGLFFWFRKWKILFSS